MRTSPDNILLRLEAAQEQQIREIFSQLHERGFPAQQQTPHITITFSPQLGDEVINRANQLLPALIPAALERVGTVTFGTKRKQTVAWLLEASEELEAAAREISSVNLEGRGRRWTPHLTLGLRLPREMVPGYLAALDELTPRNFKHLRAVQAAVWKPRLDELTVLAQKVQRETESR